MLLKRGEKNRKPRRGFEHGAQRGLPAGPCIVDAGAAFLVGVFTGPNSRLVSGESRPLPNVCVADEGHSCRERARGGLKAKLRDCRARRIGTNPGEELARGFCLSDAALTKKVSWGGRREPWKGRRTIDLS